MLIVLGLDVVGFRFSRLLDVFLVLFFCSYIY